MSKNGIIVRFLSPLFFCDFSLKSWHSNNYFLEPYLILYRSAFLGFAKKRRDFWSKFQTFLTLQARVMMFSFKRDYSAHPPSFSVTLLSHSNSLIIAPKQCGLVKFCFNTVKEGEIWGTEEKKSSLNSHAF